VVWFVPAAAGAVAAGLARAAASVAVRRIVIGTVVYFGAQYVAREAIEQTEETMKAAFTAGGNVSEAASESIDRATRNLWLPAIVAFVAVSAWNR
jgi:hypothetical protein